MNLKEENIVYDSKFREAIYYSILKCPDGIYRLYSNQWLKSYRTAVLESVDGIHFSDIKNYIFDKSGVSHNFFPFYGKDNLLYGIGGVDNWKHDQAFHDIKGYNSFVTTYEEKFKVSSADVDFNLSKHKFLLSSKKALDHVRGLYLFKSEDGISWDQIYEEPIITVFNKGYKNAIKLFGKSSEFDGHVNCVYNKDLNLYIIYLRANVQQGFRYIQYSTSTDLRNWSEFKLLRLYRGYVSGEDNYYTPCMFKYNSVYIGVVPYFNLNNDCCLRFITSVDGVNWFLKKELFKDKTAFYRGEKPKNTKHLVNGIIEKDGIINLYVHENFFGLDKDNPVTIKRFSISKEEFEDTIYGR